MRHLWPRLEFLLQAMIRTQKRCPHCGSEHARIVARKYVFIRVRRCDRCELLFTDPIYRSFLSRNFYENLYDTSDLTTRVPEPAALEEFKRTLFAGTNKDFSQQLSGLSALGGGRHWAELGSSWGYFLFQAKVRQLDVVGVEVCKRRREYGIQNLGVRIVPALKELGDDAFDLLYARHVLEHFTDLSTVFSQLHRIVRPGGFVVIEVPNVDLERFGRPVLTMMGAVHPIGFDSRFFARALPEYGFDDVRFFDSYQDLAGEGAAASTADSLLVRARKASL
jgi:SAM-dependent methyltransferase